MVRLPPGGGLALCSVTAIWLASPALAMAAVTACQSLNPPKLEPSVLSPKVEAMDLMRLRDIGGLGDSGSLGPSALAVSPDGKAVAFQLRQADIKHNTYCLAMFVIELEPGRSVREVDQGGDLISYGAGNWGLAAFPTGVPYLITPKWSPDGEWVAYLKKMKGQVQVWRALRTGGKAESLAGSDGEILDFAWTSDGGRLVFSERDSLAQARGRMAEEGLSGQHFDDRFVPRVSSQAFPHDPLKLRYLTADIAARQTKDATAGEISLLQSRRLGEPKNGVLASDLSAGGAEVWVSANPSKDGVKPMPSIQAITEQGKRFECTASPCRGSITGLWWTPDQRQVLIMARQGWADSQTALYRWTPGEGMPIALFITDDVLNSCRMSSAGLVCLREGSTQPRQVVMIDTQSGQFKPLFDPNPEWKRLRLGSVQRLKWLNRYRLEAMGDLVLPPDHLSGQKHPLIIVQYETRGFLRGGTGDEYPIQALAASGFAVLSFQRPKDFAPSLTDDGSLAFQIAKTKDWADRRSVQSALEAGIAAVAKLGVIDTKRIGITGFSDGASTTVFALINNNIFKAAAMSTCCVDRTGLLLNGDTTAQRFQAVGYPRFSDDGRLFWQPMSLSLNADRISTPILFQLPDDEYLNAMETYRTLKEKRRPVDMYVFDNEHHFKWQPAHRLAIYERNLEWFDFWLNGIENPSASRAKQYADWHALRAQVDQMPASP